MAKIRVLVVDDAVVFRRLLAEELGNDPALDVVGTAANGKIALAKLPQLNPDLVILDVEMPELDGLATLAALRKTYPRLPVIMFSALTERGAEATLEALALGATDYFTKPANAGSMEASLDIVREQLIPKIKALCGGTRSQALSGARPGSTWAFPAAPTVAKVRPARALAGPVQVLAIGASTGGPNALTELFGRLPDDFPVPIVIVQHMPPLFTRLLAERLSAGHTLRFHEGSPGCALEPGHAWIAPGDHHMIVARDGTAIRTQLHQQPPENSCRPAVDVLFRSVAKTFAANSLGVVLTGMGQDGLRGSEALSEAGGQILVQDEATSVVWGMPGYVARAGLADQALPLALLADEILRRVRAGR
jgi:two-component system, chemotaxis family, protein-glutamate methylesterase/glutaminase